MCTSLTVYDMSIFTDLYTMCIFFGDVSVRYPFHCSRVFPKVLSHGHFGVKAPVLPVRNADWVSSSANVLDFSNNALRTEKH
jgi:hypothetical protein